MDDVFFWMSKLFWMFVRPDSLLFFWLLVSVFFLHLGRIAWAKYWLISLLIVVLFIGLFPVDEWLFYPLDEAATRRVEES